MSPQFRTVLRDVGVVLHVPGLMALLSLPVCWVHNEWYATVPLLLTAAASVGPGQALYHAFSGAEHMRLRDAMVTVVIIWTLVPLIGVLPFMLVALHLAALPGTPDTVLALFESMSGFTSTGVTMAAQPSELPGILQWWRSFMQWIGGVGVIVLMLSVFHPSGDAYRLYFSEGRRRTLLPDVADSVRTIWWIYLLYAVAGVLLLRGTGMNWWQAINYGMTGIATGGFGITDNGLADFETGPKAIMICLMLAGAISFAAHYRILTTGRLSLLWKDSEYHTLLVLLGVGSLALAVENRWYRGSFEWLDSIFQWISALATAGFSTINLQNWSPTALLLLSFAMVCGRAAGATTGGLKLRRVVRLTAGAYDRIRGLALHPWRLMEHKPIADEDAERHAARTLEAAAVMGVLWLVIIVAGTAMLLHAAGPPVALHHVVLEVSSALGNVGLTAGISTPDLHWSGKVGLTAVMWMGRLEIVPVLVLIAALLAHRQHRIRKHSRSN